MPADNKTTLDGQGSARNCLQDAKEAAAAGKQLPVVTMCAAEMKVEGKAVVESCVLGKFMESFVVPYAYAPAIPV